MDITGCQDGSQRCKAEMGVMGCQDGSRRCRAKMGITGCWNVSWRCKAKIAIGMEIRDTKPRRSSCHHGMPHRDGSQRCDHANPVEEWKNGEARARSIQGLWIREGQKGLKELEKMERWKVE